VHRYSSFPASPSDSCKACARAHTHISYTRNTQRMRRDQAPTTPGVLHSHTQMSDLPGVVAHRKSRNPSVVVAAQTVTVFGGTEKFPTWIECPSSEITHVKLGRFLWQDGGAGGTNCERTSPSGRSHLEMIMAEDKRLRSPAVRHCRKEWDQACFECLRSLRFICLHVRIIGQTHLSIRTQARSLARKSRQARGKC
jgi:predicted Fe-S protein YdhL (DUF1289 family)